MQIKYTVIARREATPVRGNALASGDDALDRQVEDEIIARLDDGDVWAWAEVQIRASIEGISVTGNAFLGCCSYEDEADFRKSADFIDMCEEARQDLVHQIQAIKALDVENNDLVNP